MVEETNKGPEAKPARAGEWFREAWTAALGKVGEAEEEVSRMLHRAGEAAGWKPEDVKRMTREFAERLAAQRRELDERIEKAVARAKFPRREALDALMRRVDKLAERVETLAKKRQ
jgi:polyhydroxyalkanoate synthesis regulator phasin